MAKIRIQQVPVYQLRLSVEEFHALRQAVERVVAATADGGEPSGLHTQLVELDRALHSAPFPVDPWLPAPGEPDTRPRA